MKFGRQEQTPCLFTFRHWLYGPQGDGLQGSTSSTTGAIQGSGSQMNMQHTRKKQREKLKHEHAK